MRVFRCKDHPEANGRKPQFGDIAYFVDFPLEDGDTLRVLCGEESFSRFSDMIGRLLIDNTEETT